MCGTDAMAAELSRRVRDDLIRWGIVDGDGPAVTLMNGYQASAGDWIMARKNRNDARCRGRRPRARQPRRARIVNTDADGSGLRVRVERLTGRDPVTGAEQWSAPFKMNRSYLWRSAQLAYAVSFHAAEGRTVDSGIAVITGAGGPAGGQRGADPRPGRNEAYVICGWNLSDSEPGPGPAPELARHDMLAARTRRAAPTSPTVPSWSAQATTAEAVLGTCLDDDGRQLSATDSREADWSDADRLDVLAPQWTELQRHGRDAALRAAAPRRPGRGPGPAGLEDPAATWLWRTLREAEAAGLDGPATLRRAVASGPLDDAESVAKVLDWRIRQHTAGLPALAARPWASSAGSTGDPDTDRYCGRAGPGDGRPASAASASTPPSTTRRGRTTLGAVPEHPVDRAEWEHKAGLVAAYREMWGHAHPHEPIGPRPTRQTTRRAHAMWQAAAEALGHGPAA